MRDLRNELEQLVRAVNKPLFAEKYKEKVKDMSIIELLRNIHPLYRSDYAYLLLRAGQITKEQACEFTKIIKNPS